MAVYHGEILKATTAKTDVVDVTEDVVREVRASLVRERAVTLFVPGSTAALTTIEFESVINDLKRAIEKMAPETDRYDHDKRWGDGNGYSHVRAALLGPSLHTPIIDGRITLGAWQQIVLLDFDNRPRQRRIVVQVWGDAGH